MITWTILKVRTSARGTIKTYNPHNEKIFENTYQTEDSARIHIIYVNYHLNYKNYKICIYINNSFNTIGVLV